MWKRKETPSSVKALAEAHGWSVNDYLPDRFSACASTTSHGYEITVTQDSETGKWSWLIDPGQNWGRGCRSGHASTMADAMQIANERLHMEIDTLF